MGHIQGCLWVLHSEGTVSIIQLGRTFYLPIWSKEKWKDFIFKVKANTFRSNLSGHHERGYKSWSDQNQVIFSFVVREKQKGWEGYQMFLLIILSRVHYWNPMIEMSPGWTPYPIGWLKRDIFFFLLPFHPIMGFFLCLILCHFLGNEGEEGKPRHDWHSYGLESGPLLSLVKKNS